MEKVKDAPVQSEWKVTEKEVFESIVYEQYAQMGAKTTVCLLILHTGYEVVGTSSPVDPANFDLSIGKELAREDAVKQVWSHLGSIVQWRKAVADNAEKQRLQAEQLQQAGEPEDANPPESEGPGDVDPETEK